MKYNISQIKIMEEKLTNRIMNILNNYLSVVILLEKLQKCIYSIYMKRMEKLKLNQLLQIKIY